MWKEADRQSEKHEFNLQLTKIEAQINWVCASSAFSIQNIQQNRVYSLDWRPHHTHALKTKTNECQTATQVAYAIATAIDSVSILLKILFH